MVSGLTHVDDLAVADELGVPILGPEPAIAQLYSTKSGGRRIFAGAEIDVPPGRGDIYSLHQVRDQQHKCVNPHHYIMASFICAWKEEHIFLTKVQPLVNDII